MWVAAVYGLLRRVVPERAPFDFSDDVSNSATGVMAIRFEIKAKFAELRGFVAQILFEAGFPLLLTESSSGNSAGNAKSGEAVEDRGSDLDLGNLPIEVARA